MFLRINKKSILLSLFFAGNIFATGNFSIVNNNLDKLPKEIKELILDFTLYSSKSEKELFDSYKNIRLINKNFKETLNNYKYSPKIILNNLITKELEEDKIKFGQNIIMHGIGAKLGSIIYFKEILYPESKLFSVNNNFQYIFQNKDDTDKTVFERAVQNNQVKFAICLINLFDQDEIFKNKTNGKTIFDISLENNNPELSNYLISRLDKINLADQTHFDLANAIKSSQGNKDINRELKTKNLKINTYGYIFKNLPVIFSSILSTYISSKFNDKLFSKFLNSENFSILFDNSSHLIQRLLSGSMLVLPVLFSIPLILASNFISEKLAGTYANKISGKYNVVKNPALNNIFPYFLVLPISFCMNKNVLIFSLRYDTSVSGSFIQKNNQMLVKFLLRFAGKK